MERKYIFFRAGRAFLAGVVALVVAGVVGGWVISLMPDVWILHWLAALFVFAVILWIPFWLDCRLVRKRKIEGR